MGKPAGQQLAVEAKQQELDIMKQNQAQFQEIFKSIQPYAQSMMGLGFTPEQFMKSPLGQSLLAQVLPQIAKGYKQGRQNVIEGGGASGQFGGGTLAGPLAMLARGEAGDISSLYQNAPLQGLNIGMQGLNALTGQQAALNPLGWGSASSGTQVPQGTFWSQGLGSALGKLAVNVGTMGASKLFGGSNY